MQEKQLLTDILRWFLYDTDDFFSSVLTDSEIDPEYSAITCRNRLITYFEYMKMADPAFTFSNIEDWLLSTPAPSQDEVELFKKKIKTEIDKYGDRGIGSSGR